MITVGPKTELCERFRAKVNKNGPLMPRMKACCHEWLAGCSKDGYGIFHPENRLTVYAHRWAYERVRGSIESGKEIHHRCENRRCVRIGHLQKVTRKTHPDCGPAINASKTHCPYGHPYSGENLIIRPRNGGLHRQCRKCKDAKNREWREQHPQYASEHSRNWRMRRKGIAVD